MYSFFEGSLGTFLSTAGTYTQPNHKRQVEYVHNDESVICQSTYVEENDYLKLSIGIHGVDDVAPIIETIIGAIGFEGVDYGLCTERTDKRSVILVFTGELKTVSAAMRTCGFTVTTLFDKSKAIK